MLTDEWISANLQKSARYDSTWRAVFDNSQKASTALKNHRKVIPLRYNFPTR